MSEHDLPTVARATVWLDTSNDTPTRPGDHVDESATTRVRMAQSARSASERPDVLETLMLERAPAAQHTLFDRSSVFATFEQHATDDFESAAAPRTESLRIPIARGTSRGLAALGALAIFTVAFFTGQLSARLISHGPQGSAPEPHPPVAAPQQPLPEAAPVLAVADAGAPDTAPPSPPSPASQAPASSARADHPSTKAAVEALARGDYARALREYQALAAERPNNAALAAIAKLLRGRVNAGCSEDEHKEGTCGG